MTQLKKQIKWAKPQIRTISFQDLKSTVNASACSDYVRLPCRRNVR